MVGFGKKSLKKASLSNVGAATVGLLPETTLANINISSDNVGTHNNTKNSTLDLKLPSFAHSDRFSQFGNCVLVGFFSFGSWLLEIKFPSVDKDLQRKTQK